MGKLWDLVEEWRTGMEFPPSHRQIAQRLEVSQSTFVGWREGLVELPKRHNIWELHVLTNIPFDRLMQAAVEDVQLFDPERAREASAQRRGKSRGRQLREQQDDAATGSQDPEDYEGPP